MNNDVFGNNHPAQYDLAGLINWFDLIFCNLWRVISPKCVIRDNIKFRVTADCRRSGKKRSILNRCFPGKNLGTADAKRFKSGRCNCNRIFGIRLIRTGLHAVIYRRCRKCQLGNLPEGICRSLFNDLFRITVSRYLNLRTVNRTVIHF